MIIEHTEFTQNSPEWIEFRKDKITGTKIAQLLQGKSIEEVLNQDDSFSGNYWTERGHNLEPEGRKLFSDLNHLEVYEVGAVTNDLYPNCSSSPDGLIGRDAGLEIKSFGEKHHLQLFDAIDEEIILQIQFNLFISERKKWYFFAFNPEVEDLNKVYLQKEFYPDPEIFAKFKQALNQQIKQEITSDEKQLISLQQSLQAFEAELGERLTTYQRQKQELESLKQKIKQETSGRVSKTVEWEGNKLTLSIYDTHSVSVDDPSLIEDQYKTEIELPDAYERDGKIYTQEINTQLVKNYLKAGKSLPPGFKDKTTRNIRLKFNGKAI